ncbi:MAG TPA: hypothetical protein VMI35_07965, partial [Puia sp.]|nr:hypothetical protein [Puia sp.]
RYQYRNFPRQNRKHKLTTIVSNEEGQTHCWINQNAKLSLGYFEEGEGLEYRFGKENKCLFIFVVEGSLKVNETLINKRDGLGVWDTDSIYLQPLAETEYLIIETPVNQK